VSVIPASAVASDADLGTDGPFVTVSIMAFDEVANLPIVADEILTVLDRLGKSYEVIIIDDGSTDGTAQIADALARSTTAIRVIHHPTNLGLGGVYRTGFAASRGDFLTFFPADGQFPAGIIEEFASLVENSDLVLGYLPVRNASLVGKLLSWIERALYHGLLGTVPKFQGIMMIRRSILAHLPLSSTGRGWAVVMELLLRASRGGYRIVSVPTSYRGRLSGTSKVNNLRTMWANLIQLIELRRRLPHTG
jgi:glycosyltransferase involved in cell wall biosynthesis